MTVTLAKREIKDINITSITVDPSNQPRQGTDEYHAKRLSDAIKVTQRIEPITVYTQGKKHVVIDGHHRLEAAKMLKLKAIPAEVFGSENEALEAAALTAAALNTTQKEWSGAEVTRFTQSKLLEVDLDAAVAVTGADADKHNTIRNFQEKFKPAADQTISLWDMEKALDYEKDGDSEMANLIAIHGSWGAADRALSKQKLEAAQDAAAQKAIKAGFEVIDKVENANDWEKTYYLEKIDGKKINTRNKCGCAGQRFVKALPCHSWEEPKSGWICIEPNNHPDDMPDAIERERAARRQEFEDARDGAHRSRVEFGKKILNDKDNNALAKTKLSTVALQDFIFRYACSYRLFEETSEMFKIEVSRDDLTLKNTKAILAVAMYRFEESLGFADEFKVIHVDYILALQNLGYVISDFEKDRLDKFNAQKKGGK